MSGEVKVTLSNQLDEENGEVLTLARLNQLVEGISMALQDGSVTAREIADGTITADKLVDDIATQIGIPNGSVTTAKLADDAVTSDKIADDAVGPNKLSGFCAGYGTIPAADGAIEVWPDDVGVELVVSGAGKKVALKDGGVSSDNLAADTKPQILQAAKTDSFSTASTLAWVSITGLSQAITPGSASNKILVMAVVSLSTSSAVAGERIGIRVTRDASPIGIGDAFGARTRCGSFVTIVAASEVHTVPFIFIDEPATESSVTYQVELFAAGSGSTLVNYDNGADTTAYFRAISTLTIQEIIG